MEFRASAPGSMEHLKYTVGYVRLKHLNVFAGGARIQAA